MIVLDTNVISEPMQRAPDRAVVAWLNGQIDSALFTTSITVMELRFGLERLPEGKRKTNLWAVLDFTLSRLIGSRILPFDTAAAIEAARIAALAEAGGTPIGQARWPNRRSCQSPRLRRRHPRYRPLPTRRSDRHQPRRTHLTVAMPITIRDSSGARSRRQASFRIQLVGALGCNWTLPRAQIDER